VVAAALPGVPRPLSAEESTLVVHRSTSGAAPKQHRAGIRGLARRNLVAAGAGALLVAVLGTVVTLGATSNNDANTPSDNVGVNPSASQGLDDGSLGADKPKSDTGKGDTGTATSRPTDPGPDGTYGTSDDPTPPSDSGQPSDSPSGTKGSGGSSSHSPSKSPTKKPPTSPTTKPPTSSKPPTSEPPTSEPPTSEPPTSPPPSSPSTSDSASGPASSAPASSSAPATTSSSVSAPASSSAGGLI
jgi:hypothetical protein